MFTKGKRYNEGIGELVHWFIKMKQLPKAIVFVQVQRLFIKNLSFKNTKGEKFLHHAKTFHLKSFYFSLFLGT